MSDVHRDTPSPDSLDSGHWQRRLSVLGEKHGLAGAVLGILQGDDVVEAAYGVTNTRIGDPVRTGTVFQIGSITKVYTATAVMLLTARGRLDLDEPVSTWLPALRLADGMAGRVTLRHLLTHTSGIAGDLFTDTGRGDDCLERFADSLATVPHHLPPGTAFSYCNAGFSLVGRVIEEVMGVPWDRAMRDLLFTPLGLGATMTLPEEALLHSAATGHDLQPDGTLHPAGRWGLPRSTGPAGGIVCTARDVLAFARFHLGDGRTPDGEALVPAEVIEGMRSARLTLPFHHSEHESLGLTWFRQNWGGRSLVGHDGSTVGQAAYLRMLPSYDLAVVLLSNGGPAGDLYRELFDEIFTELAGTRMPSPLQPPADPVDFDLRQHAGVYEGYNDEHRVVDDGGAPRLAWAVTGSLTDVMPVTSGEYETVAAAPDLLLYREPGQDRWFPATVTRLPDGRPCLYAGLRALPRTDD
jgi:CubicO group peptidase (beta-lactamase class C family)